MTGRNETNEVMMTIIDEINGSNDAYEKYR